MGLGLFLGALAIQGTHWQEVRDSLKGWSPLVVAAAVGLVVASSYLRGLRWSLLWTTRRVSALRLMLVENAAIGLNNISPVRFFDEGLELGILTLRDRLPGGQLVATMMMCRIQDLTFTLSFIVVSLAFLPRLWQYTPVVVGAVLFCVGWMVLALSFSRIVRRFPVLLRIPGLSSFEEGIRNLWGRRRRLAVTFTVTSAYWLLLAPMGLLLAKEAGINLPFHLIMVTVLGAIFFSTSLPGLPGALGTFEFAVVSLLGLWDVPKAQAVSFALVLHAVLFLPITAFTVVVLPREGIGSIKAIREIMRARQPVSVEGPPGPSAGYP
jgi:uncharacterized protein (TIRG00374 family)